MSATQDCFLTTVDCLIVSEAKHILFTLAVSLAAAERHLYHTGRERNIQRATCSVQLHAHNPFVFHAIIAAPGFMR